MLGAAQKLEFFEETFPSDIGGVCGRWRGRERNFWRQL